MQIEVWSDVVCPWCYIGKRRIETALERFEHRDDVTVTWRSFELEMPEAVSAPDQRRSVSVEARLADARRDVADRKADPSIIGPVRFGVVKCPDVMKRHLAGSQGH